MSISRPSGRDITQFSRQADIVNQTLLSEMGFTVIGAGSLGSHIVNTITMMGAEHVHVYDDDKVEVHNLAVQLFDKRSLGLAKTAALRRVIRHLHSVDIRVTEKKFEKGNDLGGIVISAVDHMDARRDIWQTVRGNPNVALYIDTRASGRVASIFNLNPVSIAQADLFEAEWLFPQEEGISGPCTEKMTTPIAWWVAAFVGGILIKQLKREPIPFHVDMDLANLNTVVYSEPR